MTKRKLPGLPAPSDEHTEAVAEQLGAVVLDNRLVPPHWLDTGGPAFGIWVEGTSKRPTWSAREAGKIAKACLQSLDFKATLNAAMVAKGGRATLPMPRFLAVVVCEACNELQLATSADLAGSSLCDTCPPTDPCPKGTKHRGDTRAPCCAQPMSILWKSTDPIPEDWQT